MSSKSRLSSPAKNSSTLFADIEYSNVYRSVIIKEYLDDTDSPSDPGSSEEEVLTDFKKSKKMLDSVVHYDYWNIMKAMKFLKSGDQKACISSLSCMHNCDLQSPFNIHAITNEGGLDTLVNLTETNDVQCRIGSLQILKKLCKDRSVAIQVVHLGICPLLVNCLCECNSQIVEYAASIMAQVAHLRMASRSLRLNNAIELLVSHITVTKEMLLLHDSSLSNDEKDIMRVSTNVAHALWVLSHYSKNKLRMLKTGLVSIMCNIILSGKKQVAIPMTGVLCECSTEIIFQVAIETEGLVGVLVKDMLSDDADLRCMCALALSRAAGGNEVVRKMIYHHKGPKVIVQLISDTDKENKRLLSAGLSALWKSAMSEENVKEYEKLDALPMLLEFVHETHLDVLAAAVGAIGEMAKSVTAREVIISKGCMTEIILLLGHINENLLMNAAYAVGVCVDCDEGMQVLDQCDGLRLLWSLLKNSSRRVKVQALWAVKPCIARLNDSGEVIRSLMGSLSLLVHMLLQSDKEVLAAVCAVISEVALDLENLAVMTEQGVVKRLSSLITRESRHTLTKEDEFHAMKDHEGIRSIEQEERTALYREMSAAIANCASLDDNRRAFGRAGVIPIIVSYLGMKAPDLLAQACRAIHVLSGDHFNCVSMQSCGAVPFLLAAMESECMVTQIASAGSLKNIRKMLMEGDRKKTTFMCMQPAEREKKVAEIEAIAHVLSGQRDLDDEKSAILKGAPRMTIKTMVSFKKGPLAAWADSQKERRGTRRMKSVMSWRERMSLFAETTSTISKERRPSETILISRAAMHGGSLVSQISVTRSSMGSRGSRAASETQYATLENKAPPVGDDGIPEPMKDTTI